MITNFTDVERRDVHSPQNQVRRVCVYPIVLGTFADGRQRGALHKAAM